MIVLIVDDEDHVREGIELAVDWEKFGVAERLHAEDGHTALELVRSRKPSVMFCDMSMAGMDGIELLHRVRAENQDIQIVVISGFDDFQYTRAAIHAGGVDYLLKPFTKRELEQALAKAIDSWRTKESRMHEQRETGYRIRQADAYIDEQKLAAYFRGEAGLDGIRELLRKIGLSDRPVRVALILPRNRMELVRRRFQGDGELFVFAVNNIMHETFQPYGSHYLCRLDDYQWLVLTAPKPDREGENEHRRFVERTVAALRGTIKLEALAGLAPSEADHPERLLAAVTEARSALLSGEVLDRAPAAVARENRAEPVDKALPRLADQQFLLQRAVDGGNKTFAEDIIRTFTGQLRRRGTLRLKDLQACTVEANHMLQQASRQLPGVEPTDLLLPLWISDLDEWENLLIRRWEALIERKGGDGGGSRAILAMREYIDRHFQEEISLSTLSERFHFSPQYIAKKFKETYNTTVTSYVTELRMEKAKSLLLHTEMPIAEIAEQLGYADENYFSRVFKKLERLSPMQYRKRSRDS